MSFANINLLYFIWIVPFLLAIIIYGNRRRLNLLTRYAAHRGLLTLVPENISPRRWIKAGLILTAVLLIAISLAGPQYGYRWEEIEQKGVDIIIALDCSRSMLAEDIQPNRLERAKREIYDLLALLRGDRAGLVAFAGTAFLQCPLTLDYTAFNLFLNALTPDYLPVGGTDLAAVISTAISAFDSKTDTDKAIILITDGEHTGKENPLTTVKRAVKTGIKIYCIGVGDAEGVPIRQEDGGFKKDAAGRIVLSKLDEETLKQIARKGNGVYVRSVAGDMDLDAVYTKEIRDKMTAVTLAGGRRQVHQNRFQWPLFMAVVLLLVERCISPVRNGARILLVFILFTLAMPMSVRAKEISKGMSAYEAGDYAKAIDHFTAAQLQHPERAEILYNLGNAFYKKGDFEAAENHLREALNTADPALKGKIHYNLGNIDYRKGRLQEAIENYKKALEFAPDDQHTKENIDFVKNVMAQKPPPSKERKESDDEQAQQESNAQQQASNDADDRSEQNPEKDQSPQPRSGGADEQSSNNSSPFSSNEAASAEQDPSNARQEKDPQAEPPDKDSFANASPEEKNKPRNGPRAEQMLNRLKDQPGRATMPAYGRTPVEKDW